MKNTMAKMNKLFLMTGILLSAAITSCSLIDEGACRIQYIDYQYRNNIGQNASHQISKMTDFIFSKDSLLYRVDDNIMNGQRLKRPINLPDGEWIVITYGNLDMDEGSSVKYTIGRTRLSEMTLRVKRPSSYSGAYASETDGPKDRIGDSDLLYFGKVNIKVKDRAVDQKTTVEMSNVHIWMHATVQWKQSPPSPAEEKALHVRLEYVPVEQSFLTDTKRDEQYNISFLTPRTTPETVSHVVQLMKVGGTSNQFAFNAYGLRWQKDQAPILRLYNGNVPLTKPLPLNRYFDDQRIDLSNARQQFFDLLIQIDGETVTISPEGIGDWDDGGDL